MGEKLTSREILERALAEQKKHEAEMEAVHSEKINSKVAAHERARAQQVDSSVKYAEAIDALKELESITKEAKENHKSVTPVLDAAVEELERNQAVEMERGRKAFDEASEIVSDQEVMGALQEEALEHNKKLNEKKRVESEVEKAHEEAVDENIKKEKEKTLDKARQEYKDAEKKLDGVVFTLKKFFEEDDGYIFFRNGQNGYVTDFGRLSAKSDNIRNQKLAFQNELNRIESSFLKRGKSDVKAKLHKLEGEEAEINKERERIDGIRSGRLEIRKELDNELSRAARHFDVAFQTYGHAIQYNAHRNVYDEKVRREYSLYSLEQKYPFISKRARYEDEPGPKHEPVYKIEWELYYKYNR